MMMRVLDRADTVTAGGQVLYQVSDQRRFAAVLSTDDMNAFQSYHQSRNRHVPD